MHEIKVVQWMIELYEWTKELIGGCVDEEWGRNTKDNFLERALSRFSAKWLMYWLFKPEDLSSQSPVDGSFLAHFSKRSKSPGGYRSDAMEKC